MSKAPRAPLPLITSGLCIAALVLAYELFSGVAFRFEPPLRGPLGPMVFEAEGGIAASFVLLGALLGLGAVWAGRREDLDRTGRVLVALFLLGLLLVPLAGDLFTFLWAWELMSASPGILLLLDPRPANREAGLVYLLYGHASAALIAIGLMAWNGGRDGAFDTLLSGAPPVTAMVLVLLGALIKAGIMPFHAWLPRAHPAAPPHVSALMSGAMVAMPAYAVLRLLSPSELVPDWPALVILLLGAASAALASLHALHERDLKRLLAMTTVAHMGLLFALVGLFLSLPPTAAPTLAPFVASAAAAYALAHGLAKGALFLVAGELHHATGELDLDRLGGLWHRLPGLALVASAAALALAGLPPFGGFPAEVAAFGALFSVLPSLGPLEGVTILGALFLLSVAAAAGLVAVAKLLLGSFHGRPRGARLAQGISWGAHAAPTALLAASLAIGVLPGLLWAGLPAGAPDAGSMGTPAGTLEALPVALSCAAVALLLWILVARAPRPQPTPPWATGGPPPTPRQTYTAQGLAMPYRILFAEILRPGSDLRLQDAPVAPFAPTKGQYEDPNPEFVEPLIHQPVRRLVEPGIERLRRFHRGPVQAYLIVALLALVFLLLFLPVIP